ncbi:hypothetical protein MMPV_006996 [Pyropia vietnamensis]
MAAAPLASTAVDVATASAAAFAAAASSPRLGVVEHLLARPGVGDRAPARSLVLSVEGGVAGDIYAGTPDGQVCATNGRVLRTLIALGGGTASAAAAAAAASAADAAASETALGPAGGAWDAAGDQLFLDWDLSPDYLSTGDLVRIGGGGGGGGGGGSGDGGSGDGEGGRDGADGETDGVTLVVTAKPHNGCAKFAARYGRVALNVVNCPAGRRDRLRGIYFRVVSGGVVRVGDAVVKVEGSEAQGAGRDDGGGTPEEA